MPHFIFTNYHTIIPGRLSVSLLSVTIAIASEWAHGCSSRLGALLKEHLTIVIFFFHCRTFPGKFWCPWDYWGRVSKSHKEHVSAESFFWSYDNTLPTNLKRAEEIRRATGWSRERATMGGRRKKTQWPKLLLCYSCIIVLFFISAKHNRYFNFYIVVAEGLVS